MMTPSVIRHEKHIKYTANVDDKAVGYCLERLCGSYYIAYSLLCIMRQTESL